MSGWGAASDAGACPVLMPKHGADGAMPDMCAAKGVRGQRGPWVPNAPLVLVYQAVALGQACHDPVDLVGVAGFKRHLGQEGAHGVHNGPTEVEQARVLVKQALLRVALLARI